MQRRPFWHGLQSFASPSAAPGWCSSLNVADQLSLPGSTLLTLCSWLIWLLEKQIFKHGILDWIHMAGNQP
jgi:hypothetical protein